MKDLLKVGKERSVLVVTVAPGDALKIGDSILIVFTKVPHNGGSTRRVKIFAPRSVPIKRAAKAFTKEGLPHDEVPT